MGTLAAAAAVRPFAGGGVPRRAAAPGPSYAGERASGKKKPRRVAPARDDASSVCLAGVEELSYVVPSQKRKTMMTCNRSNVETAAGTKVLLTAAGGETMSARELLQKRLASELDALRGLLKKAELISRRRGGESTCKGDQGGAGAPAAGKNKEVRFLASRQRSEEPLMEDGGGNGNTPPLVKMPITLVEQKQKQRQIRRAPPRMSTEERNQLAGRLSSLSAGELPGHIVEFLLKQFADADTGGESEMEINIDSVEDSVLFELKTQLDKLDEERKGNGVILEQAAAAAAVHTCGGVPPIVVQQTGSRRPSSRSCSSELSSERRCSDEFFFPALREAALPPAQTTIVTSSAQLPPSSEPGSRTAAAAQSGEAKTEFQDDVQRRAAGAAAPKTASLPGLIYRAKVRRELMEMEKAALPDERIHRRDLQRLGIAEYSCPSVMRQLGLFLKAADA